MWGKSYSKFDVFLVIFRQALELDKIVIQVTPRLGNTYSMFQLEIVDEQRRSQALREKCQNTEFFLVRIFPYLDWIWENTDQKNSVFGQFSHSDQMWNIQPIKKEIIVVPLNWFFQLRRNLGVQEIAAW